MLAAVGVIESVYVEGKESMGRIRDWQDATGWVVKEATHVHR